MANAPISLTGKPNFKKYDEAFEKWMDGVKAALAEIGHSQESILQEYPYNPDYYGWFDGDMMAEEVIVEFTSYNRRRRSR